MTNIISDIGIQIGPLCENGVKQCRQFCCVERNSDHQRFQHCAHARWGPKIFKKRIKRGPDFEEKGSPGDPNGHSGSRDAEFLLAANRHQPKRGLLDRGPRKTIPAGLGRSIIETCSLFDYFVDAQTTQINLC